MSAHVSFGCMFMIGFARFVKFYGILVALAKKHTKVKLPVWETASQWFAVGERANICLNLSFYHFPSICLASRGIALTTLNKKMNNGWHKKLDFSPIIFYLKTRK